MYCYKRRVLMPLAITQCRWYACRTACIIGANRRNVEVEIYIPKLSELRTVEW